MDDFDASFKVKEVCCALLINATDVGGQSKGGTFRGRGLTFNVSGNLQRRRGSGMEELALQVRGEEQGSPRPVIRVEGAGPGRCGIKEKSRRDATRTTTRPASRRGVNREAGRQELWNKHLLNPALALAEASRLERIAPLELDRSSFPSIAINKSSSTAGRLRPGG